MLFFIGITSESDTTAAVVAMEIEIIPRMVFTGIASSEIVIETEATDARIKEGL